MDQVGQKSGILFCAVIIFLHGLLNGKVFRAEEDLILTKWSDSSETCQQEHFEKVYKGWFFTDAHCMLKKKKQGGLFQSYIKPIMNDMRCFLLDKYIIWLKIDAGKPWYKCFVRAVSV